MAVPHAPLPAPAPANPAGESWRRPRLWAASVTVVLGLHAGALVAAVLWQPHDEPALPPAGAMMIELAPLAAAPAPPSQQPPDIPQTAARPPEKAIVEKPKPPPVKKAEVALPKPKPQTVAQARIEAPPAETVSEKTAAPAAVEAPPAPAAATPAPGASSAPSGNAVPTWQGTLRAHLERHKRYPAAAQFRRQQGVSVVRFVMDREGKVLSARLERASGYGLLDDEALALLERAQPLPPPPAEMTGERIELVAPVQFFLK